MYMLNSRRCQSQKYIMFSGENMKKGDPLFVDIFYHGAFRRVNGPNP